MRPFTPLEQSYLHRIVNNLRVNNVTTLLSVLDIDLRNINIALNYDTNEVTFKFDSAVYQDENLINASTSLLRTIAVVVNLLDDLKKNGYLTAFAETEDLETIEFGGLISGHDSISRKLVDKEVSKQLLYYSLRTIIVLGPLLTYINNEFRTNEEVQRAADEQLAKHNLELALKGIEFAKQGIEIAKIESQKNSKNLRIAITALLVSLLVSTLDIFNGCSEVYYAKKQLDQEQQVKLNQHQMEKVDMIMDDNNRLLKKNTKAILKLDSTLSEKKKVQP